MALESLGTAAFLSDLAIFIRRMEGGWRRRRGVIGRRTKVGPKERKREGGSWMKLRSGGNQYSPIPPVGYIIQEFQVKTRFIKKHLKVSWLFGIDVLSLILLIFIIIFLREINT